MRRIFSRGFWSLNGRFYGGWWQLIPNALRKEIYINDTPNVEVDFKGLHISILSAEKGVIIEGDLYTSGSKPNQPIDLWLSTWITRPSRFRGGSPCRQDFGFQPVPLVPANTKLRHPFHPMRHRVGR